MNSTGTRREQTQAVARQAVRQPSEERTAAKSPINVGDLSPHERVALGQHEFQHRHNYVCTELNRFDARMEGTLVNNETLLEQCQQRHINAMRLQLTFTDQFGVERTRSVSVRALINQRLTQADHDALAGAFASGSVELTLKQNSLATIKRDLGVSAKHLVAFGKNRDLFRPSSGKGPGEVLADLIHRFAKADNPSKVNIAATPSDPRREMESRYAKIDKSSAPVRAQSRQNSFALVSEYRKRLFLNQERLAEIDSKLNPDLFDRGVQFFKWVVGKITGRQPQEISADNTTAERARLEGEISRFHAFRKGVDTVHRLYNPFTVKAKTPEGALQDVPNTFRKKVLNLSYCEVDIKEHGKAVTTIAMKVVFKDQSLHERTLLLIPRPQTGSSGADASFRCDLRELINGKIEPLTFSGQRPQNLGAALDRVVRYSTSPVKNSSSQDTTTLSTPTADTDTVPVLD